MPVTPLMRGWGRFGGSRSARRRVASRRRRSFAEDVAPGALPALRPCSLSPLRGLGRCHACPERPDAFEVVPGDGEGEQDSELRKAEDPEELVLDVHEAALASRSRPRPCSGVGRTSARQWCRPGVSARRGVLPPRRSSSHGSRSTPRVAAQAAPCASRASSRAADGSGATLRRTDTAIWSSHRRRGESAAGSASVRAR